MSKTPEGSIRWETAVSSWHLWLWWIVATAVPGIVALALSDALVIGLPETQITFSGDNGIPALVGWFFGICLIGGTSLGLAQGLCLSRLANLISSPWRWVSWTIAGILLAMVLNIAINITVFIGAGAYIAGFGIAAAQWLALRSQGPRAAMWFLVSGIAWDLVFLVGFAISDLFLTKDPQYGLPYYTFQSAVYWGLATAVALVLYGAITGVMVVWLAKTPPRQYERN